MPDLEAVRARHARDADTLHTWREAGHILGGFAGVWIDAHADRAALLVAIDRLAGVTEEEVAYVLAYEKCHRCVRGIPLKAPGWHVGEAPCAAEVNVRETYQAKAVLALFRARVAGTP